MAGSTNPFSVVSHALITDLTSENHFRKPEYTCTDFPQISKAYELNKFGLECA